MAGGTKKPDGVAGRTRTYWDDFFRNYHNESKRKDQDSGGVDGRRKRARDLACYEPGRDGNGALKSEMAGDLKAEEVDEDIKVETLKDGDNDANVEALKWGEDDEDGKDEILKDGYNDDDCDALKWGEDDEDVKVEFLKDGDSDEDEGADVSGSDSGIEILRYEEDDEDEDDDVPGSDDSEIVILNREEDDEDEGVDVSGSDGSDIEILNYDEDKNSVDILKIDGAGILNCDKDDYSVEMIKSDSSEDFKIDEDGGHGAGFLTCDVDDYEDDDDDDDDDDDSIEYLGELRRLNDSSLKIETKSMSGSRQKVDDLDEVVSSFAGGSETDGLGISGQCSGRKPQIKPLDIEQIHRDISVDSDSSIGSRNSAEDSDGSEESFDSSQVSESEPTSEEEDELSDEDYNDDESSTSELSDDSHHDNGDMPVKGDKGDVGENDDVMNAVEEISFDTVEDERTLDSHGHNTRKNLRKGSDTGQEKDEESDEEDEHGSDNEIFVASVKKFSRVRKSKPDLERDDDEVDERVRKCARKKQKGDGEEETKSHKDKLVHGKWRPHVPFEVASTTDKGCKSLNEFFTGLKTSDQQYSAEKVQLDSKKSRSARELDLIKILVNSINSVKENQYKFNENALDDKALPLKFRFEDEVVPPPEKSEWEVHIDSLFRDLDLGLLQSDTDCTDNVSKMEDDEDEAIVEVDESIAACCSRGKHHQILDEQIGIICKYCNTLIMDIKHVLPSFHKPTQRRWERQYYYDEPPSSFFDEIQFQDSAAISYRSCSKGTVWDLIPGVEKELYPHQRDAFKFIWRNFAGDIVIEKLKQTLTDDARGCIISHAPGTGKTRLTIVFLQSFLKLYPACCPMIIAPKGMLLTWEAEFKKWNFNVVFHNLNEKELSGKENAVATQFMGLGGCGILSQDCIRLLKLYSWSRGGSILGISYTLFVKLAGENGRGEGDEKIREVLLERAGLLVLDEGHTPRNNQSLVWKALTKVATRRRIILSGTPFQNNLKELFNTLCVVDPRYANQEDTNLDRKRWRRKSAVRGDALSLKAMLDPYVHVHKGTILEESLPGMMHTLVFLHPTEYQKTLLKEACEESEMFRKTRMVSLVSVHPSINAVVERYSAGHSKKLDIDAGVKARFLMKLIQFSDTLQERVLVFSQYLDSLIFIKEQLDSIFSWKEGREVLYIDGQQDEKKRQHSINACNDETSEAKVILASEKACSEGISLVGASRVVLLDTVWNPSVEKQAISRAYRIGQKKIVHVYRLFTSGIEVRQYAQQMHKERMSQWVFSLGFGHACRRETDSEDKVLGEMRALDGFKHIFENVISQPKESDLINIFKLHN